MFGIALNPIIYKFKYKEPPTAQLLLVHPHMFNINLHAYPPNHKVLTRAVLKPLDIFNIMIVILHVLYVKIALLFVHNVMLVSFY